MSKKQLPDSQHHNYSNSGKFVEKLLKWELNFNLRTMPWKGEKDPYRIWLSEIILQQTRVEQGMKYYEKFISNFPDLDALASAPEEKVFKLWEGLGYYSRCRNLIATARIIKHNYNGKFPDTYENIIALKGIGAYTAAAISSFAYNLPYAVVDGNVLRVLSRIFGIHQPVDSSEGKKIFSALAQSILPRESAGLYNQAIMDFGATVCKPKPDCNDCFFNQYCIAFKTNSQKLLPVKQKQLKIRYRQFHYFFLIYNNSTLIRCRVEKDIWQNLYEFPMVESKYESDCATIAEQFLKQYQIYPVQKVPDFSISQKLTHQQLRIHIYKIHVSERTVFQDFKWISMDEIFNFAFPRALAQFLQQL